MAVNIVKFGNRVLMDISDSTLTAQDLLEGVIAYNAKGERIVGTMAQTAVASLFELNLADTYNVTNESEAPTIIADALNIDGFVSPIGTSGIYWKKPVVTIPSIDWATTVDENYDIVGTGTVIVRFGDAGAISKTVTFKKPGEGKVYGAKTSATNTYIDTGIAADYSYTYHGKGWGASSTSVLMGALVSTTARTTFRILPSSNKIQAMWPANKEVLGSSYGFDVNKEFEYWINANEVRIKQGSVDITIPMSGTTSSGLVGANIHLFNETSSSNLGYGTSVFNEVLQGDTVIAYFAPFKLLNSGEIVIINTSGLTAQQIYDIVENGDSSAYASRILRPTKGTLVEVTP